MSCSAMFGLGLKALRGQTCKMQTKAYMKPVKANDSPDAWPTLSSVLRLTFALHFSSQHAF